jgi:thiamine biosynthesis protein ThiS
VQVIVNGERRQVPEHETILGLIQSLELAPDRVAVELDREIVKKANWGTVALRDGATLEIVQFVGGG